ncbi:MAG: TetR/AcrR family transcriptional regulator [Clostridia bacterium]|nr:TetR/AcrR family transcriptional regulator [Clostridia bacterium]
MARKTKEETLKDEAAKIRILNSARQVFSEKGYDAASIAEIAKRANVNKALPYYYFENKRKILEELIRVKTEDTYTQRMNSIENTSSLKESIPEFYKRILNYNNERKELFKILVVELLKDSPESMDIIKALNPVFGGAIPEMQNHGVEIGDREDMMIKMFFLSFMPIVMFITLNEKWSDFYGFDQAEVKEKFIKAFNDIYIKYAKDNFVADNSI